MRDERLFPLFADLGGLPGVGPKMKPLLAKLVGGETVLDLLFHLPTSWIDRRNRGSIAAVEPGSVATVSGVVDRLTPPPRPRLPARVRIRDETGFMTLVYFHANKQWLERTFPEGKSVVVSGTVQDYQGGRQMTHPDHVLAVEDESDLPPVEPVYPMTANLPAKTLRKVVSAALAQLPQLVEWIDPHLLARSQWPSFADALKLLHEPATFDEKAFDRARRRLAYDEAFAREVAIGQARLARERRTALPVPRAINVERMIIEALPFRPTRAQMDATADVARDMERSVPMRRMIQGDVGSGKTLVAALAAAQTAAAGRLTAVMSPTEVLARQQAEALSRLLAPAGIKCAALTGRDKGGARAQVLEDMRRGEIQVVSGTQALYQTDVDLPDLGLIVIDEQHRFGVADRLKLTSKGEAPHMLVMSATPIPRTMALAVYGDLDISLIREKPANRKDVITAAVPDFRIDEVLDAVARAAARQESAFWVCPAVDSEDAGEASAIQRHAILDDLVDTPVVLVHGRMSPADRDEALESFRKGRARVLVATTVIEVGVDVPDATIIVVERAEKFGLAQLHQLRGRVGRGDKPSSCVLLYHPPLTDGGKERLDTLRKTSDGFEIAEADFKLRGPGDLLGLRQSGTPEFRLLDLTQDADLLETARTDARSILNADPRLSGERGKQVRLVRDMLAPRIAVLSGEADQP